MIALLRLFRFLRGSGRALALSFGLLLASTALGLVQPRLIEMAIDRGIEEGSPRAILWGAAGIILAAVLAAGLNLASGYALIRSSQRRVTPCATPSTGRSWDFPSKTSTVAHGRTHGAAQLGREHGSDVLRMGMFIIVQSVIMIAGTVVAMYLTDPGLARVMAVFMPLILILFFGVANLIRPLFMRVRVALDALNNTLQENLAGAKLVRAFARQREEIDKFARRNRDLFIISMNVGYKLSLFFPLFFLIAQMATVVVLWSGGTTLISESLSGAAGNLTLGKLIAFNNYATMAMFPLLMLGMVLNFVSMAMASAIRLEALFAERASVQEHPAPRRLPSLRGEIRFEGVSFRYGKGERALDDIHLVVHAGEKLGIIGATGSGKSTLAHLILRFYDPEPGNVRVDGIDVRDLAFDTLRTRIALVLQETVLFSGTVRDNIAFAAPDAPSAELEHAAAVACADEFIELSPEGWNTPVGQRGAGLSGGQRQRVAIARAVAARPDVIVLDDVTSSLDAATERRIIENLYREFQGRTAIIISQKVNTIRHADRIAVMEGGRIADVGTHEELLRINPTYRTIHETQAGIGSEGSASV